MNEIWVVQDKVNENWWRYQPETTLTPLKKIIPSVISSSCSHISIGLEHVYVRISSFTPKVQTDEFLLGSNPKTLKIKTAAKIHEDCNVNEAWWGGGGGCVCSVCDVIVLKIQYVMTLWHGRSGSSLNLNFVTLTLLLSTLLSFLVFFFVLC